MMNHSSLKNEDSQPGSESWRSTRCKAAVPQRQDLLPGQEFSGVFPVWKRLGETLAVLLERFRQEHDLSAEVKITYAGRLDPAAEGVVLLLAGAARLGKEQYLCLDKTYLLTILFGIKTDTADLLGLPIFEQERRQLEHIETVIKGFAGAITLPYPAYSSKPVSGKPLFAHARAGRAVVAPSKEVFIHSIEFLEQGIVSAEALLVRVQQLTQTVAGDFRQEQIGAAWEKLLHGKEKNFSVATIKVQVSSGTYMRSLAEAIGEKLGFSTCAYEIVREQVGTFIAKK